MCLDPDRGDHVILPFPHLATWPLGYPSFVLSPCMLPIVLLLESIHTVLTQPGTLVSFRGMCIYLLFNFRKLRNS